MKTIVAAVLSAGVLAVVGCTSVEPESIATPKEPLASTKQALDNCLDPNDPNTCITCSENGWYCQYGYQCDWERDLCYSLCADGLWSGDEGDVDCGGACATKCQTGQHCWTNWDCLPGSCVNDHCQ